MKISFNPDQLFDLAGNPLVSGRVSFYLKDSDTLANTYYRDGNDFIEGQNPVILDNSGSFVNTIFLDVAIYDVVVEKYTDGVYHQIENFEFGFEMPDVKNDTMVDGIEGLMNANPELGSVTVIGYDSNVSCGPRSYIWDAQCTDAADGGCIVESNSSENGRWILLSDLRELPCKYYGVAPGYESNISAFLTYPQIVGTYGIWMPPVPRFVSGVYNSTGTFSVDKTISFDPYTRFANASFICPNIECSTRGNYIADFQFSNQAYAESSWFRTVHGFWTCGATELHQSRYNYFENGVLSVNIGVANAHISGKAMAIGGSGQIQFTSCTFEDQSISTDWYVSISGSFVSDKFFASAYWDFGQYPHHTHIQPASNVVVIANFADANVYTLWAAAYGFTALDLQGRTIGTITATMPFTNIANGQINEAHFAHDVAVYGVTIYNLYLEKRTMSFTGDESSIILKNCTAKNLTLTGSKLYNHCGINSYDTTVRCVDTFVDLTNGLITRATPNDRDESYGTYFTRCQINGGCIDDNGILIVGSQIDNTLIRVIPSGSAGGGTISCRFKDNIFGGTSQVQFVTSLDGVSDPECYECTVAYIEFTGNTFNTTQMGIKMPFWAEDGAHRYINGVTTYNPSSDSADPTKRGIDYFPIPFYYYDNVGNCPREYAPPTDSDLPGALVIAPHWSGIQQGAGIYFEKGVNAYSVFALPAIVNSSKDPLPGPTISNSVYSVSPLSVTTPYRAKAVFTTNQQGGDCADYPISAYMPCCAYEKSYPNDMFYCLVGSWGVSAQFYGVNPIGCGQ